MFHHLNVDLQSGSSLAILGPNGSGKSTLLQMILGYVAPTKGKIDYFLNDVVVPNEQVYKHISFASPYSELPEWLSMNEVIDLHFSFKQLISKQLLAHTIEQLSLNHAYGKYIRLFSSGMKQRLKLALACCSYSDLLLLDEPCSNLDQSGIDWYIKHISLFMQNRTTIIASNMEYEYNQCAHRLLITDYTT